MNQLINCKCGARPAAPEKVKGLSQGYVIRCGDTNCPAVVQRVGGTNCANSWNDMAAKLN